MSAIGDYVHLRKSNYNKYGIEYSSQEKGNVINEQIGHWSQKIVNMQNKFQQRMTFRDPMETQLNQNMNEVYAYMTSLQTEPNMSSEKGIILQRILGDNWEALSKQIQINWQSGKVTSTGSVDLINSSTKTLLTRLANNIKGATIPADLVDAGADSFDLKTLLKNIEDGCKSYNKVLKEAAYSGTISKSKKTQLDNKYKAISQTFREITTMINKLDNKYEILKSEDLGLKGVVATQGTQWLANNGRIGQICFKLLTLIKKLQLPNLNEVRGSLMEEIIARAVEQGKINALSAINEAMSTGKTETSGMVSRQFDSKIEPQLKELLAKKTFKNEFKITHQAGRDHVKRAFLEYHYTSQKKADGVFKVEVDENGEKLTEDMTVGLSIKNYSYYKFGLVSGQPLMTFLFGSDLSNDEINHFLNIEAASSLSEKESADIVLASEVNSLRKITNVATGMMILYAAATGEGTGKSAAESADYLLYNDSGDPNSPPSVISMNRLMDILLSKYSKGIYINVDSERGPNIMKDSSALLLDNNIEDANQGPNKQAAYKRIAKVINQLHQIKLYASANKEVISMAMNEMKTSH